jgi:hypothetical protein
MDKVKKDNFNPWEHEVVRLKQLREDWLERERLR